MYRHSRFIAYLMLNSKPVARNYNDVNLLNYYSCVVREWSDWARWTLRQRKQSVQQLLNTST